MAKNEYLCIACGGFSDSAQPQDDSDDRKCPKCGSSNIMKLDASRLFGFFNGGG
jgi:DNA-directed RNA polymerase subunit RPC12/RpoP